MATWRRVPPLIGVALLAGCGAAGPNVRPVARSTPAPRLTRVVVLPHLGTLYYACTQENSEVLSSYRVSNDATEVVSFRTGGQVRSVTLNPHQGLESPTGAFATTTWRISQSTEPKTVTAVVRLRFHIVTKPLVDCSLADWSAHVSTKSHQSP